MPTTYNLTCINNSSNTGSFLIFQQEPRPRANIFPLAWFAQVAAPTTRIKFTWTLDYSFVWSQTGTLETGVYFAASQTWSADLTEKNKVTFTDEGHIPTFINQTRAPVPGSLIITTDASIRHKTFSVGVGMSGAGTFVTQAQPNWNLTYTPHPKYYVAFGDYTQGDVLDVQNMSNVQEIEFEPNVYSKVVTLDKQNGWRAPDLAMFNVERVAARARLAATA
jgi:rhizosphere induced protein